MPLFVPLGYSGQTAIAMIRARANEPTYPSDATVLTFLNAGIEQVNMEVGGIHLFQAYPTQSMQNVVTLGNDVQDIINASWSTTDPTQNATVYPMQQRDPIAFMNYAAGFPGVGAGAPSSFMLTQDFGTGPNGTLPPPPTPMVTVIGGASAGYTVYAMTTVVNPSGETLPSSPTAGIIVSTTQQALVASPPLLGNGNEYNVYAADVPLGPYHLQNAAPLALGSPYTIPGALVTASAQRPSASTATYPSGGFMVMQVYPPAMIGQVNLYYRGRPALWADTTNTSFTNLDTMSQEAAILWGMMRVLEHRGRADEAMQIYQPQYTTIIAKLTEKMQKRTAPKSGQVRDVLGQQNFSRPFWY